MSSFEELTDVFKRDYGKMVGGRGFAFGEMPRIPSGWFALDLALGGGIPMGKATEIYGKYGSGKTNLALRLIASYQRMYPEKKCVFMDAENCVAYDSRFLDAISGRVYTAEEVFKNKIPLFIRSYNESTKKVSVEPITAWINNGAKKVYEVRASSLSLKATCNHKLWARVSLQKDPKWIRMDELKVDHYISSPKFYSDWKWAESTATVDESRFIGLMLGDGSFGGSGSPSIYNIDPDVIQDVSNLMGKWDMDMIPYGDCAYRLIGKGKASKWHPSKATILLKDCMLWGVTGSNKFIPQEYFNNNREGVLNLLAGLYLTDGTVDSGKPRMAFSNTSLTLIEQIQELWRRLGVPSSIHKSKMYSDRHKQQYVLSIHTAKRLKKVYKMLPLYGYKMEKLKHWANHDIPTDPRGQNNTVDNYELVWTKVQFIEDKGEQQTYDFTVETTHNYVVNGIIAHNTYDKKWARKLGVDVDNLYMFVPDYGEAAIDMIEGLLASPECGLVVLDSLAALVTTRRLDNSAEKRDVGGPAFLVTDLLKMTIHTLARATKEIRERSEDEPLPTFIGLNQIRIKIGGYGGNPESTPGGEANKHLVSLQLRLYGKEVKDPKYHKDLPCINDTTFSVKKKKFPIVSTQGDFQMALIPHKGLKVGECDDFNLFKKYMEEHDILKKGKTKWLFAGEEEFSTLKALREMFLENPEVEHEVKLAIIEAEKEKANGDESYDLETGELHES